MTASASSRFKWQNWIKNLIRLFIGVGLLWITLRSIEWAEFIDTLGRLSVVWLVVAGLLFFIGFPVRCLRWDTLLKSNQISLPFFSLLRYYFRSQFFLMIVPSFIGADVARSWDVHKSTGQPVEGVSSVLVERIIGLNAVTVMGFIAIWFPLETENLTTIRLISVSLFVVVTGAWLLLLQGDFLLWLARYIPINAINQFIRQTLQTIQSYPRAVLLQVWGYSLLIQLISILFIYLLLRALQYETISILDVAAVASILTVVTIIPISPGALGLQEGAYVVFLGTLGVLDGDGLMVSLLSRFFLLVSAIIGGLDLLVSGEVATLQEREQHGSSI